LAVTVHEPPLASVPMYMYLHRKHADLVDDAARALREMKADGTYASIVAETLSPIVGAK
jgi:polar amino acid transport system substrate-binding protein